MATVENIASGDQLPANGRWALVDQERSRGNAGWLVDMMVHDSGQATFYVTAPFGEVHVRAAIDGAKAWADRNGIGTVYVKTVMRFLS